MVSPGLTLVRSVPNVPRKEGADATSTVGAACDTIGSALDEILISKACATPSLIWTGRRARSTNRAFWPISRRGVSVTDGSPDLIPPPAPVSWKKTGWNAGGKVDIREKASSALPRLVTVNGTVTASPEIAAYFAPTSVTSRPATRSTTRKTDSPAGG